MGFEIFGAFEGVGELSIGIVVVCVGGCLCGLIVVTLLTTLFCASEMLI
jgi:hypothetical protein